MTTSERFKAHQTALGLKNHEIASILHVQLRTVERWRQGSKRPPDVVFAFLRLYTKVLSECPKLLQGE